MQPKTLDHVAFWVADRDAIAEFAATHLGMHVIERTNAFTLVGSHARRSKLTLFAAEGQREPGPLKHVGLRVADLGAAGPAAADGAFAVAEELPVRLVEAPTDVDYDVDHVALYTRDPSESARRYLDLGFRSADPGEGGVPRVEVGGAFVEFHRGEPGEPERPLLNHLALLVDSADEHRAEAEELGLEIAGFVDAANTRAVFVWSPDRVKIEYVEHKPSFSLV